MAMYRVKLLTISCFVFIGSFGCICIRSPERSSSPTVKPTKLRFSARTARSATAPEAEGQTLDDGQSFPACGQGEFKFRTEGRDLQADLRGRQRNAPFRNQLTEREIAGC